MTRMPQAMRKKMKELPGHVAARIEYMGTDKYRAEYTVEVMHSLERFRKMRRQNLFAIVMPSGSGKTQLCKKFGFVDIDLLCTVGEHEYLNEMRIDALRGKSEWDKHNKLWIEKVNGTLDLFSFKEPVVILVHSEIIALQIGALPLAGFAGTETLFKKVYEQKLANGNEPGARLMALNRVEFTTSSNIEMRNKRFFRSFEEGERLVLLTLNINEIPVACPYKYTRSVPAYGYSEECPDWVLTGDKEKLNVQELLGLYYHSIANEGTFMEDHGVPKVAMDYFLSNPEIPSSFGFGLTDNDWGKIAAQFRAAKSVPTPFNTRGDLGDIFPYKYKKNETRANITVSRMEKTMQIFDDDDCYYIASHHVGKPNNFVTGVLCYWVGLGSHTGSLRPIIREMLCTNFTWWSGVMKDFHNFIRQTNTFWGVHLTEELRHKLLYLDVLLGKEQEEADWMQEIEDRTWDQAMPDHKAYDPTTQLWTTKQYIKDFNRALDGAYCRLGKPVARDVPDFKAFYERRGEWLTKGSTVLNDLDPEMRKYTVDLINECGEVIERVQARHNKKSLFEVMDAIPELGDRFELFNATKIVTKLDENGHKRRALLPGSLMHYLVFSYVLYFVEKDNQVAHVRLNAPPDDEIVYFEQKMAVVPRLLFDWANFNLYHSAWEMEQVVRKLEYVVDGPHDYGVFVDAIAKAMYHMVIIDPEGGLHKAGRGLYSGWRGTTWINTVLNAVYTTASGMSFERLYGREPYRYVDGGGDDHDGGLNNPEDGYRLIAIMRKMGFKASAIKQMVSMKSEFFRNTITVNGVFASPVRTLTTFVNGKWEGSGNVPIKERITSILDQVAKMRRRGVESLFCNVLGVMCLSHWCKVNQDNEWLDLPSYVIHGSSEDGGFGVPDDKGQVWRLRERVPEPLVVGEAGDPPGTLATRDWLRVLCREVEQLNVDVEVSREKIADMAKASFDIYSKYDYSNVINFRTEVVARVDVVEERYCTSTWELLMDWIGSDKEQSKIGRVMRYQEIIPYMTVGGRPVTEQQMCDILGVEINCDALHFKGDVYYRRLISEPLAKLVTEFCTEAVAQDACSLRQAEEMFKDLCYMMYINTEFKM